MENNAEIIDQYIQSKKCKYISVNTLYDDPHTYT